MRRNFPYPQRYLAFLFVLAVFSARASHAQDTTKPAPKPAPPPGVLIKLNDETFFRFGFISQVQANVLQESLTNAQQTAVDAGTDTRHWIRQFQVRRLRLILGGTIAKNTTLFFDTDITPAIGSLAGGVRSGTTKNGFNDAGSGTANIFVQDLYLQHTFAPEFSLLAGMMLDGISRNGLQSMFTLMALNYGAYSFSSVNVGGLQNAVGRDVGFMARGFLADERLEYRLGVFEGRNFAQYSPLRTTLRLNYNFLDREKGYFYTGTFLGKGQTLAVGGGVDMQGGYVGFAGDVFADVPVGDIGSVTANISFMQHDGGSDTSGSGFGKIIPKQTILFGEVGLYLKESKLMPYLKYETQVIGSTPAQMGVADNAANLDYLRSVGYPAGGRTFPGTTSRLGVGINYFFQGHNSSLKLLWESVTRNRLVTAGQTYESASNNEFTLQWQWYLY